ncbi:MarR family transcriptional regulator [Nocardia sp. NPDC059764]|uniref:MarR family transcriptional regulator n=1 Tax=Nocardia sp. NPDC059764 TaxID=3346939 RepID=UPI00364DDC70
MIVIGHVRARRARYRCVAPGAPRGVATAPRPSIALVDESITIAQFRTLVILSTRGPSKVVTLSNALNVQPSTAARMVDRLVAAGLVNRKQNPESRRELIIELTTLGHRVVDQAITRIQQSRSIQIDLRTRSADPYAPHRIPPQRHTDVAETIASIVAKGDRHR